MRWTYIIPRLIMIGLLWGFLAYAVDPLLRYSTVQSIQSVTGAKVDVAKLHTTYFAPSLTIQSMALAAADRPGKNMVEFDDLHVRLESHSLSRRRFVIEDGHIVFAGSASELLAHGDIMEFYVGKSDGSGDERTYRNVKQYRRKRRWWG